MILTIIVFLLILSILVFVHEAGHFFVAKWSGIKVEEFGFGLPPRAIGKRIGETIYSINWLPFGGFVKLYGEDEAGSGKVSLKTSDADTSAQSGDQTSPERSFANKPLKNRILVVVAGVFMNLLLAIGIYYAILAAHGFTSEITLLFPHHFVGAEQTSALAVTGAANDTPAKAAGLKLGDLLIAIDGQPIHTYDQFKNYIDHHKGTAVTLTVLNDQYHERAVLVTPRVQSPDGQGALGLELEGSVPIAVLQYKTPVQKIFSGVMQTYNVGVYSFEVFGKIIGISFQQHSAAPVRQGVAGPIGIAKIVKDLLSLGGMKAIYALLEFMALLSLNLAVVNIFPFPALDGGRLLFLVIEGVTRKRVQPQVERVINTAGMAILLGLILLVTYNDLLNIFH